MSGKWGHQMSDEPTFSPTLVRDLMTVGVQTCSPQTPIAQLARWLLARDLEGMIVLDDKGHAVGVADQDDLVRAYVHPKADRLTAEDVMRDSVPRIPADIPATAACQLMQDMGVRAVFLMHHDRGIAWPSAILSHRHFLRHLAAQGDEDLRDLGARARREAPLEAFRRRRAATQRESRACNQE